MNMFMMDTIPYSREEFANLIYSSGNIEEHLYYMALHHVAKIWNHRQFTKENLDILADYASDETFQYMEAYDLDKTDIDKGQFFYLFRLCEIILKRFNYSGYTNKPLSEFYIDFILYNENSPYAKELYALCAYEASLDTKYSIAKRYKILTNASNIVKNERGGVFLQNEIHNYKPSLFGVKYIG